MKRTTRGQAAIASWVLAIVALAAPTAFAQAPEDKNAGSGAVPGDIPERFGASNPPPFERADSNKDGVLEPAEIHAYGIPFALLDTNRDGFVTRTEYLTGTAHFSYNDSAIELR